MGRRRRASRPSRPEGLSIGQQVWLGLRPEKMRIGLAKPENGNNVISGKVDDVGYLGSTSQYHTFWMRRSSVSRCFAPTPRRPSKRASSGKTRSGSTGPSNAGIDSHTLRSDERHAPLVCDRSALSLAAAVLPRSVLHRLQDLAVGYGNRHSALHARVRHCRRVGCMVASIRDQIGNSISRTTASSSAMRFTSTPIGRA